MTRRTVAMLGAVVALAGAASGCGGAPVLGVLLPTTGSASTYGESIESGVRLALSEARGRGELPEGFEVVWADTGSDPQQAVAELRQMVAGRGVKMVLGGATSAEARALLPVLDDLGIVCLSPSASAPGLAAESRHFFRIFPSDELEGGTAGRFLYDRLNLDTVLLYVGDTEYTRGIEPEFRRQFEEVLGGRVVDRIEITDEGWPERSAAVLARGAAKAVYVVGYADQILAVLRHLREQGFEGRVLTTSAFYSSRVVNEAGALAEGVLFPLPPFDRTSEKEPILGFVTRYMDTYQMAPDVFAAHGYDAMRLAILVLTLARPPETTAIRRELGVSLTEFTGVTGPILFDEYGDVKHYPKMFIVADRQVVSYQRYLEVERARILRQVQNLLINR